jgi:hypothetical protein
MLFAGLCTADDRIVSVDPKTKLLTVEQGGQLKLYHAEDSTEVTLNGVKASFSELQPGHTVAVKAVGAVTALRLAASGLGHAPTSSSPLMLRSVAVQIRVDGSDRVLYSDGKLWIEHLAAQKPTSIFINGVEWTPTWKEDKTEPFTNFVVPVAPIGQAHVSLKQFSGRGKTKLEHSSKASTAVAIDDGHPGADNYEFLISW